MIDSRAATRRDFLKRAATGTAGLAILPNAGLERVGTARHLPPLPTAPSRVDEAYWRDVKAQFLVRDGFIMMNAANLCPAPRTVVDAVAAAMRDLDADVSFQNREKYSRLWTETAIATRALHWRRRRRGRHRAQHLGGEQHRRWWCAAQGGRRCPALRRESSDEQRRLGRSRRAVRVHGAEGEGRRGISRPNAIIDAFRKALLPNTRVLSITDVSSNTGVRLPSAELCALARARGIWAHVDGAQTLGALRRDMRVLGCDSYSASSHKWFMGPKEAGVLFVRKDRCAELWPGVVGVGWGTAATTQVPGARKFETLGQRNDATAAGLVAALDFHDRVGAERIETRTLELTTALHEGCAGCAAPRW